jgi:hypothetical protein
MIDVHTFVPHENVTPRRMSLGVTLPRVRWHQHCVLRRSVLAP